MYCFSSLTSNESSFRSETKIRMVGPLKLDGLHFIVDSFVKSMTRIFQKCRLFECVQDHTLKVMTEAIEQDRHVFFEQLLKKD